ncbi:MAG: hypothetical protein ACYDBH_03255 [Acidobacteriaceae bacterium]
MEQAVYAETWLNIVDAAVQKSGFSAQIDSQQQDLVGYRIFRKGCELRLVISPLFLERFLHGHGAIDALAARLEEPLRNAVPRKFILIQDETG